jgi:hypothetical protein
MTHCISEEDEKIKWNDNIQFVLDSLPPLEYGHGNRLPLFTSGVFPGQITDKNAEILVRELDRRGIGVISRWDTRDNITGCLALARAQKKYGLPVSVDATFLMNTFFNGEERTAHIDNEGKPFFDSSFGIKHKMGCPFAIDFRKSEIRGRFESFIRIYKDEELPVNFISLDWEIDGPLEVNRAYETSKRCERCRKHLGNDFTFNEFQKKMREMRSFLQYYTFSSPVHREYPDALAGNYAVYPNDGYRYWYDYFEYYVEGQPYKADQAAKYRQWYNDFPATGFNVAMPVVYTWYPIYNYYDFNNSDFRWFYNMLLVASNAGKSTPRNIPVISFVTWHTVWVKFGGGYRDPDPAVIQMSGECYQELLWHMLLRRTNTFWIYSAGTREFPKEIKLVHEVYCAAQEYGDFLEDGLPITFDVPGNPGVVISGLIKDDQVLVRRTDFGVNHDPVEILAGTKMITISYLPGACQIIDLYKTN